MTRAVVWRWAVMLAAAGAVLAGLVGSHAFTYLNGKLLLAVVIVQPLGALAMLCVGARLHMLAGPKVSTWTAIKSQSLAILVLYVLPSRLSEFIKPVYIADHCGISTSRALAAVVCERLSDILILALGVALAAGYLAGEHLRGTLPYWICVAGTVIVVCAVLMLRPQLISRVIALIPSARLVRIAARLLQDASVVLTPRVVPAALAFGILGWAFSYLMAYALLWFAGSKPLEPGDGLVVFLASSVGLALGVAPGGLGTYEGAVVVALSFFGYDVAEGLALAIGMRASSLLFPGLIALRVLARERTGVRSFVKRMRAIWQSTPLAQEPESGG